MSPERIDLVRCYEGVLIEEEWVGNLLAPSQVIWRDDPLPQTVTPGAIYVVAGVNGLPAFSERFLAAVAKHGDCGLLHLGDEFMRADYRRYAAFAFVLRNYHLSWLRNKGVLTFPLGYPPGLVSSAEKKVSSARKYLWAFLGVRNASRADLVRAWSDAPRGFVSLPDTRAGEALLPRQKYFDVMNDAAFAPAPMGNVVTETWRLWESMELGAIPVAPSRIGLDYYKELLGAHPIPTFRTWRQAAAFVSRFETDPVGLDSLQSEVLNWWGAEKAKWSCRIGAQIEQGRAGLFAREMKTFESFSTPANRARRMVEFLKHHDGAALKGRAEIVIGRIRDKVTGAAQPDQVVHPLDLQADIPPRPRP